MAIIDSFRGEYGFLSNFHKSRVEFEGMAYPSAEHAFQAAKNPDPEYRSLIASVSSPVTAKRMGKKTQLRPDWEEVKDGIMYELLKSKFSDPVLREKLLATGEAELIEGNNHWDRFWGVCRGEGLNKLGKLLMQVREELNNENN
ncbi:MAG: NADAR family protein [Clostridia bacterium]|nr:NADAR family protein [Clostridia bacterium]